MVLLAFGRNFFFHDRLQPIAELPSCKAHRLPKICYLYNIFINTLRSPSSHSLASPRNPRHVNGSPGSLNMPLTARP